MTIISNRRSCSLSEINALKMYLSLTPVRWLVQVIDSGAKVSKGGVTSLSEIGKLRTIWSELGGIRSSDEHGSQKFLVSQVVAALRKPQCNDRETYDKIREYVRLFADGQLELKITLLEDKNEYTICDGNKRAVACFEYGLKRRKRNLSLPVYVIALP